MCGDKCVDKNLKQRWTICCGCKPLHVVSRLYVSKELRRFPHLKGDVQVTWDGQPLIANVHFSWPRPQLRGVHLVVIDPIAHPGGNWTFETRRWCIDTCGAYEIRVPWMVRNGASGPVDCPGTTIVGLLQRLTSRDAPPFRVIAMAVFDDASLSMAEADQHALTSAQLLTVRRQFRHSWAAVIQMRPELNGSRRRVKQGSAPVTVDLKVPWT
ncbi:hypothetical protein AMAG_13958 [Allomyces macrogynus ATCC 38327]|uniref:Uncharacterized protein n=1 Tax=Allomyces macrogynus (strain ATCC 38327) TaxID=578462 RepID=A0A0L0T3F8_ALLM3|nr:hypothetical protein AMAG_13958 [Allomyces macrogynus ATCC 38327]|eukprot:KNE69094.1 hypothetical protein AMAG_13958 [Allomyces macrogynus ATCC 38327]